jgi:DNA invertase Pin-like site-specific DNA recombinase
MKPAVYARVSTGQQELQRQLETCTEYALSKFDVERSALTYYRDTDTGSDTKRDGFQQLLSDVESGVVSDVVVHEISRLSRSMTDLSATVDRLKDAGVGLHVYDRDLVIDPESNDPMTEAFFYLMGVFAQLERDMIRQRVRSGIREAQRQGKHTGRTPYGFTTDDEGYLIPNDDYETACIALEQLQGGESKRSVAKATGISRRTLGRIEKRAEMYTVKAE